MRNLTLLPQLYLLLLLLSSPIQAVHSESDGGKASQSLFKWEILTKRNFSSEIRLHPSILLIVTVPWSGESRSLVKELLDSIIYDPETFDGLELRLLYRNSERMLADALGATQGITIFYYRQGLSYKYRGRLRVENILSSVRHVMSLLPEELPLMYLNAPEDLRVFLSSTDKALLLLEFCGWTQRLLGKGSNNASEDSIEAHVGTSFSKQTYQNVGLEVEENEKHFGLEKMKCHADEGIGGISWPYEFTSVNDSTLVDGGNMTQGDGVTCTSNELQQFEKFLPNFLAVVREYFLPPQRLRFGVIRERSLLSLLNVKPSGSWGLMLHIAGCPNCSKVLKEDDDLKTVLQTQASPVIELEDDVYDVRPSLPVNKPSILLFIDRSSESFQIREDSSKALRVFREIALHYQNSDQMSRSTVKPPMGLDETHLASRTTSRPPRSELFPAYQKVSHNDKVSVMIMNEGNPVNVENYVSELQGSSLHEILTYILQKKKKLKLSSLAKDAGFQLLSEDIDIKVALQEQSENPSGQVLEPSSENALQGNIESDEELTSHKAQNVDESLEDKSKSSRNEISELIRTLNFNDRSSPSEDSDGDYSNAEIISARDDKAEEESLSGVDEQKQLKNPWATFFFCDGQYRSLKALTGGIKVPALVIIDPILRQHYVLPKDAVFSYSELSDFLHGFLNGSLPPYQQSEPVVLKTREGPSPPFVNLDFHEVDSIPRVTVHTFSDAVFGNHSDYESAGHGPNRNVLVLFSNSWCGFCQRMELVVREVYRAIKGYANMLKEGLQSDKPLLISGDVKKAMSKLPVIYLMDCTLNDCSLILKSMVQRELYPALLLFPAGRKSAVVYEGDIAVSDVLKFLTVHGTLFHGLVGERDLFRMGDEQVGRYDDLQNETSARSSYHKVMLKDRLQEVGSNFNQIRTQSIISSHETNSQVVVGSMLIATDKLLDAHPFDESKILIVQVDQSTGYQGLIVNKQINWDSLEELEEGLALLKEAPLSFGGPVLKRDMPLVALARKHVKDEYLEVLPDIYFLDHRATLNLLDELKAGNQSIYDYWFFLGFSSWGWHQLFSEIAEGAWNVTKSGIELLDWPWR